MDKDDMLRVRVPSSTKSNFEQIAEKLGRTPSVLHRELIEKFVNSNLDSLPERVLVYISRPEGYHEGVWTVLIKLRNPQEAFFYDSAIPFTLPQFEQRRLTSDKGYGTVVGVPGGESVLGGNFIDGEWRGHLYSNGLKETANPTSSHEIQKKLTDHVSALLDKFKE